MNQNCPFIIIPVAENQMLLNPHLIDERTLSSYIEHILRLYLSSVIHGCSLLTTCFLCLTDTFHIHQHMSVTSF